MGILGYNRPPIKGSITIDLEKFPKEILEKMISFGGGMPVISIEIPQVYMQGGSTLTTGIEESTLEFDFVAYDININPA